MVNKLLNITSRNPIFSISVFILAVLVFRYVGYNVYISNYENVAYENIKVIDNQIIIETSENIQGKDVFWEYKENEKIIKADNVVKEDNTYILEFENLDLSSLNLDKDNFKVLYISGKEALWRFFLR